MTFTPPKPYTYVRAKARQTTCQEGIYSCHTYYASCVNEILLLAYFVKYVLCVCVHDGKWLRGYLLCNRKHNAIYTYMDVKCKGICKICCCYSNVCNVIKASRRKCISIFAHIDACKIYCNKCILYFIKHFTFIVYNVERDSRQERYEKKNCIRILFIF